MRRAAGALACLATAGRPAARLRGLRAPKRPAATTTTVAPPPPPPPRRRSAPAPVLVLRARGGRLLRRAHGRDTAGHVPIYLLLRLLAAPPERGVRHPRLPTDPTIPRAPACSRPTPRPRCVATSQAYVGTPYETSMLDLAYQLPDQDSWGNGIRHVVGLPGGRPRRRPAAGTGAGQPEVACRRAAGSWASSRSDPTQDAERRACRVRCRRRSAGGARPKAARPSCRSALAQARSKAAR